ncbi:MAG TPA: hypothetical protein DCP26_02350 [Brevundimonas sp.]|nr:hypothetical protein [Brevundimonas sp.]
MAGSRYGSSPFVVADGLVRNLTTGSVYDRGGLEQLAQTMIEEVLDGDDRLVDATLELLVDLLSAGRDARLQQDEGK